LQDICHGKRIKTGLSAYGHDILTAVNALVNDNCTTSEAREPVVVIPSAVL